MHDDLRMKKIIYNAVIGAALFIAVSGFSVHAASLEFDSASSAIEVDETFTVTVDIDAGTDQIEGTDIYVSYDDDLLDLQSVTGVDYFPIVGNTPETSRLYIYGVVANQGEYKTGTGSVATLVFKGVAEGETDLTFDCDLSKTDTSKIAKNDINASNIIDCSQLEVHTVTIGAGSASTSTSTKETTSSLPESGTYDMVVQYALMGGILLLLGAVLRMTVHV